MPRDGSGTRYAVSFRRVCANRARGFGRFNVRENACIRSRARLGQLSYDAYHPAFPVPPGTSGTVPSVSPNRSLGLQIAGVARTHDPDRQAREEGTAPVPESPVPTEPVA